MNEEKTIKLTNGQLREDEDICLILRGKVIETAPLGNGLTEIYINVDTVNGTTPVNYTGWFPLKLATPLNKEDEVTIRVAVVKPTSTADDFITATIDFVGQVDGGQFEDFSFFAEVKSSISRDGSFWILLPTNSVDNDEEEKVIYLRFELIQPESDEAVEEPEQTGTALEQPSEVVLTGTVVSNDSDCIACVTTSILGLTDVQIYPTAVNGITLPSMKEDEEFYCFFPLPDYPELETQITFRVIPNASASDNDKQVLVSGEVGTIYDDFSDLGLLIVYLDVVDINGNNIKDEVYQMGLILPTSFKLKEGDKFQFAFELIDKAVPDNAPEQ